MDLLAEAHQEIPSWLESVAAEGRTGNSGRRSGKGRYGGSGGGSSFGGRDYRQQSGGHNRNNRSNNGGGSSYGGSNGYSGGGLSLRLNIKMLMIYVFFFCIYFRWLLWK